MYTTAESIKQNDYFVTTILSIETEQLRPVYHKIMGQLIFCTSRSCT